MSSAKWKHFGGIFSREFQMTTTIAATQMIRDIHGILAFFLARDEMHIKTYKSAWACGQDVAQKISRLCSLYQRRRRWRWWKYFRLDYFYHNSARVFELALVGFHRGKSFLPSLPLYLPRSRRSKPRMKRYSAIFSPVREGRARGGGGERNLGRKKSSYVEN
jgi:hypothetical protein